MPWLKAIEMSQVFVNEQITHFKSQSHEEPAEFEPTTFRS